MASFDTSNDTHKIIDKPLLLNKIDDPIPVFFYQRRDGSIFSCHENEAWTVHEFYLTYGGYVGRGDGKAYHAGLVAAKQWQDDQVAKLHLKLRGSKAKIRRLERKAKLTKKEEAELDALYDLEENFNEHLDNVLDQVKKMISDAWHAEMKAARGKFTPPSDQSVVGNGERIGTDGRLLNTQQFRQLGHLDIDL